MKDGSRVVIKIEYKPQSVMNSKGEKIGSYYFIAKHFFRTDKNAETELEIKKNPIKNVEAAPAPRVPAPRARVENFITFTRIYISFYDREGHVLLKGFTPDGYSINFANHEKNTFGGGVEWKGQFDESRITLENFRDIHSITVRTIRY